MKYLCFEKEKQECYLVYGVKPPREITETMDVIEVEKVPQKEGHSTVITRDKSNDVSYDFEPIPKSDGEIQSERILQLEMAISDIMGMEV